MTEGWMPDRAGHDRRDKCRLRAPPGASGRGCAPVPSLPFWRRGLSERSACPACPERSRRKRSRRKRSEGTLNQRPTAYKKQILHCVQNDNIWFFWGPRPGANGFGFFCRNKRTSSCGGETPQDKSKNPGSPIGVGDDGKGGRPCAFLRRPYAFSPSSLRSSLSSLRTRGSRALSFSPSSSILD